MRVRPHRKIGRGLDVWPEAMRIAGTRNEVRVRPHRKIGRGLDVWPEAMRIAGTRN
ncbi:MAG: hypothetical protein WB930_04135 [Syntrophobacteraceae bacterium]